MLDFIVALETRRGRKIRLEELEALVQRHVDAAFGRAAALGGRDNPAFGRKCYTAFNLEEPLRAWVEQMKTAKGRKLAWPRREAQLGKLIRAYLRRPAPWPYFGERAA